MNPGLVVKLRPSGPWRIGPDSGARNRVDAIYHSDSLYSAVTAAMARLGWLEEWLDAHRPHRLAGGLFQLLLSVPRRDRLRGSAAHHLAAGVPLGHGRAGALEERAIRSAERVVQSILAGRRLDENQWSVDGPSECLVPADSPGPFRTAVRWSAAVDRLTGRRATGTPPRAWSSAPDPGLWTVVSFRG